MLELVLCSRIPGGEFWRWPRREICHWSAFLKARTWSGWFCHIARKAICDLAWVLPSQLQGARQKQGSRFLLQLFLSSEKCGRVPASRLYGRLREFSCGGRLLSQWQSCRAANAVCRMF